MLWKSAIFITYLDSIQQYRFFIYFVFFIDCFGKTIAISCSVILTCLTPIHIWYRESYYIHSNRKVDFIVTRDQKCCIRPFTLIIKFFYQLIDFHVENLGSTFLLFKSFSRFIPWYNRTADYFLLSTISPQSCHFILDFFFIWHSSRILY